MGKILCFIYDDMADFELTLAANAASWIEKEVVPIAYDLKPKKAKAGLLYLAQMTVTDALKMTDVDGIIIPGGWNDELRDELKELILKLNSDKKLLAAICAGPQYLAKSGVLEDKKYTTTLTSDYFKEKKLVDFFNRDNFISENVVRDQNIVTAIGRSFVDFAMEILAYFNAFNGLEMKNKYSNYYKGNN